MIRIFDTEQHFENFYNFKRDTIARDLNVTSLELTDSSNSNISRNLLFSKLILIGFILNIIGH